MLKDSGSQDKMIHFEQLFRGYHAKLHRYAFTLLKDTAAASDIVQQVFKNVWEKRETLQWGDAISGYLYKATYNLCLNSLRDQQVRRHYTRDAGTQLARSVDNARDKVMVSELARRIQVVTESLPAQCRLIFIKSRWEGKKYADIAHELNISEKTVEAQIGKALRIFRTQLADYLCVVFLILTNS